jgi:hypothetical protein
MRCSCSIPSNHGLGLLGDTFLCLPKHMNNWPLNKFRNCETPLPRMHQTHWQMNSNGCHGLSQEIMYCKMQSSRTRNTWACSFNPKSVATLTRSQAIIKLRDALLLYGKHIGHLICLKSKCGSYSCSVSSNHIIPRCTALTHQTHWPLWLKSKCSS